MTQSSRAQPLRRETIRLRGDPRVDKTTSSAGEWNNSNIMRQLVHVAAIGILGFLSFLSFLSFTAGTLAEAQTRTTQMRPPQTRTPVTRPRVTPTKIVVRDRSGTPLGGTRVTISGAMTREVTTDESGTFSLPSLRDGSYRLRFEHDGFITLEREVTVRNSLPTEIAVALNVAPRQQPPEPAPQPSSTASNGSPAVISIPEYQEKNSIGRDPLKESVLGCTAAATIRLLQLRDPLALHTHANLDEVLYVVAGEGALRIADQVTEVTAGSLSVIPRGLPHALARRGRNPLVVISTLSGGPCQAGG